MALSHEQRAALLERGRRLAGLVSAGRPIASIARSEGVTATRVRQILLNYRALLRRRPTDGA